MSVDPGPVIQSALLRSALVRLRREKGVTQEEVAKVLEWSPSKVIRVEGGRSSITKVDLDALLVLYGVGSERERERLHELNRGARGSGWWLPYRGDVSDAYLNYVGYEAGATFIRQFHGAIVPGLLQTPEYARAILSIEGTSAASIKLRFQRQEELARRGDPPRQNYVVDEAAIRRHVGVKTDPGIMPAQLHHIIDMVEAAEWVTVRVVPFDVGEHAGMAGPFTLLEFMGDLSDLLYLDGVHSSLALVTGDNPLIADYHDYFEALLDASLPLDQSLELIRKTAAEMT
jgi:transcriptional regulator with XRE-family HTH domain